MSEAPAERHRRIAARFTELVRGTPDWQAPAPVPGWAARDVVAHLVEWLPGFLASGGVRLPTGPPVEDDPVAAWQAHVTAVQHHLDDPAAAGQPFTNPHLGTHRVDEAIDRFYTTDVFLHTWDLGRASGQDDRLDAEACAQLLAGMEPMDQILRDSGQYGPRVPVPEGAGPQDRLIGFIGRDPAWRPPSS